LRAYALYRQTIGRPPFANSDVAICGSKWSIQSLKEHVKSAMLIESLPYPVDLNAFTSVGRPLNSKPLILWAGRSVPRKRLDLFLDACARLLDEGRDFNMRVIGGFSFAPGYQRLIDEFRHPQRLHYSPTVPRQQMPEIYRQATVLLQPSEDEDFGSGIAEALACGTPVVLGPTNGTGDYVEDAGFKFSTYDTASVASAIAAALDAVASNPSAITLRSRQTAERFFNVQSIVTRLEQILYALVNQPSQKAKAEREDAPLGAPNASVSESRVTA
jgi:glycosyltransferase involved in cell wall biosynthesis